MMWTEEWKQNLNLDRLTRNEISGTLFTFPEPQFLLLLNRDNSDHHPGLLRELNELTYVKCSGCLQDINLFCLFPLQDRQKIKIREWKKQWQRYGKCQTDPANQVPTILGSLGELLEQKGTSLPFILKPCWLDTLSSAPLPIAHQKES